MNSTVQVGVAQDFRTDLATSFVAALPSVADSVKVVVPGVAAAAGVSGLVGLVA